jgi:hypothetical protein
VPLPSLPSVPLDPSAASGGGMASLSDAAVTYGHSPMVDVLTLQQQSSHLKNWLNMPTNPYSLQHHVRFKTHGN